MPRSRVFGRFCIAHDEASRQNELDENPRDDNPRPLQNILNGSETKEKNPYQIYQVARKKAPYQIHQVARKEASVCSMEALMKSEAPVRQMME